MWHRAPLSVVRIFTSCFPPAEIHTPAFPVYPGFLQQGCAKCAVNVTICLWLKKKKNQVYKISLKMFAWFSRKGSVWLVCSSAVMNGLPWECSHCFGSGSFYFPKSAFTPPTFTKTCSLPRAICNLTVFLRTTWSTITQEHGGVWSRSLNSTDRCFCFPPIRQRRQTGNQHAGDTRRETPQRFLGGSEHLYKRGVTGAETKK